MSVWVYQYRLFDIGIEFKSWWWAWILCFFLDDLAYYAFHRSAHRVRWFWASHVIHHSSQHYNPSTALRQTWTGFFSLTFLFRSEEHTSELQSLMRISYAVFCLKTKRKQQ